MNYPVYESYRRDGVRKNRIANAVFPLLTPGSLPIEPPIDRDDVSPAQVEKFLPHLLEMEEEGQTIVPCFTIEGITFMHIRFANLYSTSITAPQSSPAQRAIGAS